jgi:hypothetical protein
MMIPSGPPIDNPKSQKLSVTALLSLIFSFIPLLNILGILFGVRSLREIKKSQGALYGKWLGIGGIVVGSLGILLSCVCMGPSIIHMRNEETRAMESDVRSTANTLQTAVGDYKKDPKHQGLKPATVAELTVVVQSCLPKDVQNKKNPFNSAQDYGTVGSGIVFGLPSSPGQIGYVFTDQHEPYTIIALGKDRGPILTLTEGL